MGGKHKRPPAHGHTATACGQVSTDPHTSRRRANLARASLLRQHSDPLRGTSESHWAARGSPAGARTDGNLSKWSEHMSDILKHLTSEKLCDFLSIM